MIVRGGKPHRDDGPTEHAYRANALEGRPVVSSSVEKSGEFHTFLIQREPGIAANASDKYSDADYSKETDKEPLK